ncbi:MFS transporter [Xylocopilactobacillus apicola]|uniref:MFS transporter n=1 Tax=Xylocopilactobacillus apicola TaxID=2932184 RepID=A0AAU9DKK8_9LACO|nr:MFS transporter [Xylocopilactobacillus apicola]BDR59086.1 MFS transporter [Xylocopilactobacillus apicola]
MKEKKFGIILPIILVSYFLILLDNSIVFTSSLKIAQELHLDSQMTAWVSNAYALTFGGFIIFGGRMGDIFGRKRIFLIGISIFSICSLLVGLAQSGPMIIAARAAQGLGSAILAPTTLALLMDNYQGKRRSQAIAYYGATTGIGASVGLVIGGLIASYASWRWGFFLNFPLGLVLAVLTSLKIPQSKTVSQKMDWGGTLLSVLGLTSLIAGINLKAQGVWFLIAAVIFLILFLFQEKRTAHPLMPLSLFADSERTSAYLARFTDTAAMTSYLFLTPQVMQQVLNWTPLMAAFGFLPQMLLQFLTASMVNKLAQKWDHTFLSLIGAVIFASGMFIGIFLPVQNGYVIGLLLPLVLTGLGQGLIMGPLTISSVARTNEQIAGAASGTLNMAQQIGSSFGLSLIVTLTTNYHQQLIIMTFFAVILIVAVSVMHWSAKRHK